MATTPAPLSKRLLRIENGHHLSRSGHKHLVVLKAWGITEADLAELAKTTTACEAVDAAPEGDAAPALEDTRNQLNDSLGRFRRSAKQVVLDRGGLDKIAERELKINLPMSKLDGKIAKITLGLPAALKRYSTRLVAANFSKELQTALVEQIATWKKAVGGKKTKKVARRGQIQERESLFEQLDYKCLRVRAAGHAAFYDKPERHDFDAIRTLPKAPKAKKNGGGAPVGSGGGTPPGGSGGPEQR